LQAAVAGVAQMLMLMEVVVQVLVVYFQITQTFLHH